VTKIFIPWAEFAPDFGMFRTTDGGAARLVRGSENIAVQFSSYLPLPFPSILPNSQLGTAQITKARVLPSAGSWKLYAGDAAALHEYNPAGAGAVVDVSKIGGYTSDAWQAAVFGENVIFTNGVDPMQLKRTTDAKFIDLVDPASPFTPTAKFVSTFRQHTLLGNYAEGGIDTPNGVWWSALNDARSYGTATDLPGRNSDRQPFGDDLGAVRGLLDMGEYELIWRDSGITRMDGLPASFTNIENSEGTPYSNSLVSLGGVAYYMRWGGVSRCDGGKTQDFGGNAVNRLLFDPSFTTVPVTDEPQGPLGVYGAADPASRTVVWSWRSGDEQFSLLYNVDSDRFSWVRMPTAAIFAGNFWRCLATRPYPGGEWYPLSQVLFVYEVEAGGTSTFYVGDFDNDINLTARFKTGFMQHDDEHRVIYRKVRPVFRLKDGVVTPPYIDVSVRTTSVPWDPSPPEKVSLSQDRDGAFILGRGARAGDFNSIEVQFGPDNDQDPVSLGIGEFEGVEVDYDLEGDR